MAEVKFEDLLGTGAHFGHVVRKWNPNYQPYILMEKNGIHIINLEETIKNLEQQLIKATEDTKQARTDKTKLAEQAPTAK